MLDALHISSGEDHSCDAAVARWFAWRLPMLELRDFRARRGRQQTSTHHIVEFDGDGRMLVALGIVPEQILPRGLRKSRNTRCYRVRRLDRNRFRIALVIWLHDPLPDFHSLAPLCPSRWPIDGRRLGRTDGASHLRLVKSR